MSILFNIFSGEFDFVGAPPPAPSSSFETIQAPLGTSPVATTPFDTLTLTSSGGSLSITGNSGTDTVNFDLAPNIGVPGGSGTQLQYRLTSNTFGGVPDSTVDATDKYLGLGGVTPTVTLHVGAEETSIPPPTNFTVSQTAEQSNTVPTGSAVQIIGPDDSSSISPNANQSDGSGTYTADGSVNINYTIYGVIYIPITGNYYYTNAGSTINFTDNNDSSSFGVDLSWSAVSGATSYIIQGSGSASSGNPNFTINVGNVTAATDNGTNSGSISFNNFSSIAYPYDPGGTPPNGPSSLNLNIVDVGYGNLGPANGSSYTFNVDSTMTYLGQTYCSGSPTNSSISDNNDGQFFDISLSWTDNGNDSNSIVQVNDPVAGIVYFFAGSTTGCTYNGQANDPVAAARWGQTYPGPPGSITRQYEAYGKGSSPTNNTLWFSTTDSAYSVNCTNSINGYVVQHSITQGSQGASRILGDYYGLGTFSNSFDTTATTFIEGNSNLWTGPNTVTPNHYGIDATGQTLYWRLYAHDTSPSSFYSNTYLQGSSTLPNDGNYYTFNISWTTGVGSANTKILESTDGSNYTIGYLSNPNSFIRESNAPSFIDGTTVTPNVVTGTGLIAQNASSSLADAPQLIVKSTNSNYERIEFWNSSNQADGSIGFDAGPDNMFINSIYGLEMRTNGSAFNTFLPTYTTINTTNTYGYSLLVKGGTPLPNFLYGNSGNGTWYFCYGNSLQGNGASVSINQKSTTSDALYIYTAGLSSGGYALNVTGYGNGMKIFGDGKVMLGAAYNTSSWLSIQQGTSSMGQINFSQGSLTSSLTEGDLQFDGNHFYLTDNSTTSLQRHQLLTTGTSSILSQNIVPIADGNGNLIDGPWHTQSGVIVYSSILIEAKAGLSSDTGQPITCGGLLSGRAGTGSTGNAVLGLFNHFTDVGNSTTAETTLYTDNITAGTLNTNGYAIIAKYAGTTFGSTSTKEFRVYLDGTVIFDSGALAITTSGEWDIEVHCMRDSTTTARCAVTATIDGLASVFNAVKYTTVTVANWTATRVLKITGQAASTGAATNDIVAKFGKVEWHP